MYTYFSRERERYTQIYRKFRRQTSDNLDRWNAEMGRVREEKRRRKNSKKEKVSEERRSGARKGAKHCVFFQWFVVPEGWKVGSLKRRVRSQLARWEMKNCTPLWRETDFQVKMCKVRSTFWSWDVEKVQAVVDPRWASLDRIRGVQPKKNPGPLGPISYTHGTPTSPREFYPKTPLKKSYIHLPGLHEFYPPALAPKILYSLTWSPWILSTSTCLKDSIFTYLVSMNFIYRHLSKDSIFT